MENKSGKKTSKHPQNRNNNTSILFKKLILFLDNKCTSASASWGRVSVAWERAHGCQQIKKSNKISESQRRYRWVNVLTVQTGIRHGGLSATTSHSLSSLTASIVSPSFWSAARISRVSAFPPWRCCFDRFSFSSPSSPRSSAAPNVCFSFNCCHCRIKNPFWGADAGPGVHFVGVSPVHDMICTAFAGF